ncbi:MAG: hypothetical protein KDB18_05960, partial [Salinibacterium sp.]|nr:hypothetical protein [Salinibacterium sp.]
SNSGDGLFGGLDNARVPLAYLAKMFGAGNESYLRYALQKQMAVRTLRRAMTVGDIDMDEARRQLREADCSEQDADAIYRLTALCTFEERFVIPPSHREEAIEMLEDPLEYKQSVGFGFRTGPKRGL